MRFFLFVFVFMLLAAPSFAAESLRIHTQGGQEHVISLEIADEPEEWQRGLMGRAEMPRDHGMLFVFSEMRDRAFWMKDTLIPLDMVFIGEGGVIVHIHENAAPRDETLVLSGQPCLAVLEVNGGTSRALGLKVGDRVVHSAFQ